MQPINNLTAVKEFLKQKPPTFKGGMDPIQTNEWIEELEKNFGLLQCSDQQKVKIGSYLLTREANRWWNLRSATELEMTWARFLEVFRDKYMPRAMTNAKRLEFENLKQRGAMTVAEYDVELTNLAEYAPYLISNDELKA